MRRIGTLVIILALWLVGSSLITAQEERLRNPGLEEGDFGPYLGRRGGEFPIYLPEGWNAWLQAPTAEFFNREERTTIQPHPGPGPDPLQGQRAVSISCGFVTCTVAIYQQVAVQPGVNVQASAWAHMKVCNLPEGGTSCGSAVESGAQTRIGIDPNGGTNPLAEGIVWSGWAQPHDRWDQMTVSATTAANTITLFLFSTQASPGDINKTYWDQTSLTGGGSGSSTAVPPTATPPPVVPFVNPQGAQPDGSIVHTVQQGDTIDSIAVAYGVSRQEILDLNNIAEPRLIRVGQQLVIREAPPATEVPTEAPTAIPTETPAEIQPTATPEQVAAVPTTPPQEELTCPPCEAGADSEDYLFLVPPLLPPPGVSSRPDDNSNPALPRTDSTSATLITTLSAEELITAYNEQLAAGGWQLVGGGTGDGFGWSGWRFNDPNGAPWGASLTITRSPIITGEYVLSLRLEQAPGG